VLKTVRYEALWLFLFRPNGLIFIQKKAKKLYKKLAKIPCLSD
jgi:hypothetical protein